MQRPNFSLFLRLLVVLAVGVTTTVQADDTGRIDTHESSSAPTVSYDRVSDQLSVSADTTSLKSVLGRVAALSGIEVLFDDQADAAVSIDFKSESLDAGLKRILKGRNSILRYSQDDSQDDAAKLLLIGVTVLPAGEQDSGRAKRLLAMDDEAYDRARSEAYNRASSQLSQAQTQQLDMAAERWQARLAELPPERRAAMEKRVDARLLKQAQRDQQLAEKRKKMKQQAWEDRVAAEKSRQQALEALTPEQRTDFEQRGNAAREEVKALLFNGRN